MEDSKRSVLDNFQGKIEKTVKVELVREHLLLHHVLCHRRFKSILDTPDAEEKAQRLLYEIKRSDHPNSFSHLIQALQPSYPHLASDLNSALMATDEARPVATRTRRLLQRSNAIPQNDLDDESLSRSEPFTIENRNIPSAGLTNTSPLRINIDPPPKERSTEPAKEHPNPFSRDPSEEDNTKLGVGFQPAGGQMIDCEVKINFSIGISPVSANNEPLKYPSGGNAGNGDMVISFGSDCNGTSNMFSVTREGCCVSGSSNGSRASDSLSSASSRLSGSSNASGSNRFSSSSNASGDNRLSALSNASGENRLSAISNASGDNTLSGSSNASDNNTLSGSSNASDDNTLSGSSVTSGNSTLAGSPVTSGSKRAPCENLDVSLTHQDSKETKWHQPRQESQSGPAALSAWSANADCPENQQKGLNLRQQSSQGHETQLQKRMWESENGPAAIVQTVTSEFTETVKVCLESSHEENETEYQKQIWESQSGPAALPTLSRDVRDKVNISLDSSQDEKETDYQKRLRESQSGPEAIRRDTENEILRTKEAEDVEQRDLGKKQATDDDADEDGHCSSGEERSIQRRERFSQKKWQRTAMRKSKDKGENMLRSPGSEAQGRETGRVACRVEQPQHAAPVHHERLQGAAMVVNLKPLKPLNSREFEVILRRLHMQETFGFKYVNGCAENRSRWHDDDEYYVTLVCGGSIADRSGQMRENDTIESVNGTFVYGLAHDEVGCLIGQGFTLRLRLRRYAMLSGSAPRTSTTV